MPANITSRKLYPLIRSFIRPRARLPRLVASRPRGTNGVIIHDPFAFFVCAESSVAHAPRASDTDGAGVPAETPAFRVTFRRPFGKLTSRDQSWM